MVSNINIQPLRIRSTIPNKWYTRPRTPHYDKLSTEEHFADGWRDVVEPVLLENQQKGQLIYDEPNDVVTWAVIDMTPQQIEQRQQQQLDSDASSQKRQIEISDGQELFEKFLVFIQRQSDTGNITANQAIIAFNMLYMPLLPLKDGMFRIAQSNLNSIQEPANQKLLNLLNQAKEQVNYYISQQ